MKKIILLILVLLLSGCYEESGKLITTCVKEENMNSLYKKTTYDINFKSDEINEVVVTYYYKDSDTNTLSSVKSSINSTEQFIIGLKRNIEIDNDNEFKISYNITLEDKKEILNKFEIQEKRSELVNNLKEKGYECS